MARVMAARRVWDLAIGKTKTTLRGVAVTPDGGLRLRGQHAARLGSRVFRRAKSFGWRCSPRFACFVTACHALFFAERGGISRKIARRWGYPTNLWDVVGTMGIGWSATSIPATGLLCAARRPDDRKRPVYSRPYSSFGVGGGSGRPADRLRKRSTLDSSCGTLASRELPVRSQQLGSRSMSRSASLPLRISTVQYPLSFWDGDPLRKPFIRLTRGRWCSRISHFSVSSPLWRVSWESRSQIKSKSA
jgi:hypothetical protein